MPVYLYEDEDGELVELVMSVEEMRSRQREDGTIVEGGRVLRRNMGEEVVTAGGHRAGCWPKASWGAGVHPSQVAEAHAKSVKDGVPTEFTRDGDPIFTSRGHRSRYLKTIGMHDRDGGYGD